MSKVVDKLIVRAYNVGFGDAILIKIPEKDPKDNTTKIRHVLIDVGTRKGGKKNDIYKSVLDNVIAELNGEPLDLYIMTHEHTDHSEGLNYAENSVYTNATDELKKKLDTHFAWLTASADENYLSRFTLETQTRIKNFLSQQESILEEINSYLTACENSGETTQSELKFLWEINELITRDECVKYLRKLTKQGDTHYVYRGCNFQNHNPFKETKIEIWAPEEDTSVYFNQFQPISMNLGITPTKEKGKVSYKLTEIIPPRGVDAGAFYNLVKMRHMMYENLILMDKAGNDTSIVFCIEWRGYRLLFTGDAEERSWDEMYDKKVLKHVHFLKISHHGSVNGTPEDEIFDEFFPVNPKDDKPRISLVSSIEGSYGETVPDPVTLRRIDERCEYLCLLQEVKPIGDYIDIEFPILVGNKNTKKVHLCECSYIKLTRKKNKEILPNISYAIEKEYDKCSKCLL